MNPQYAVEVVLDKPRAVRMTTNGLAALEEKYGCDWREIVTTQGSITAYRALLWAGLLHEFDGGFTEEDAGRIRDCDPVAADAAVVIALQKHTGMEFVTGEDAGEKKPTAGRGRSKS